MPIGARTYQRLRKITLLYKNIPRLIKRHYTRIFYKTLPILHCCTSGKNSILVRLKYNSYNAIKLSNKISKTLQGPLRLQRNDILDFGNTIGTKYIYE